MNDDNAQENAAPAQGEQAAPPQQGFTAHQMVALWHFFSSGGDYARHLEYLRHHVSNGMIPNEANHLVAAVLTIQQIGPKVFPIAQQNPGA